MCRHELALWTPTELAPKSIVHIRALRTKSWSSRMETQVISTIFFGCFGWIWKAIRSKYQSGKFVYIYGRKNSSVLLWWVSTYGHLYWYSPSLVPGTPSHKKSMTRDDYETLIDKIRTWLLSSSRKTISYTGRLQLIYSVIVSNKKNFGA